MDLLLSKLDKQELVDFIRKECSYDGYFRDRFLALGAGTLFKPDPQKYTERIEDLIRGYGDRRGYIEYSATYDFNRSVMQILEEAEKAMGNHQWEVAIAVLSGISDAGDDILDAGDDSSGELGGIVCECILMWHELCENPSLPEYLKSELFELVMTRFNKKLLKGWDWWWDWMQMAIDLADTPEKKNQIFKALDAINSEDDSYYVETAQKYKLELMSRCRSPEEQRKYMEENVGNPDFRKHLIQMAWDKGDYEGVLRLAKDGVKHDADLPGLLDDWHKWEYKVYRQIDDKDHSIQMARYFFFKGGRWAGKEFSMEAMYSELQTLVPNNEWDKYVETLISEALEKRDTDRLLYLYIQEQMWEKYMAYIRKNPTLEEIENAPDEVKGKFKEEIIRLYATGVRNFLDQARNLKSYRKGVYLLRKLINSYGGKAEADQIVIEQKAKKPRRPALINELSKL